MRALGVTEERLREQLQQVNTTHIIIYEHISVLMVERLRQPTLNLLNTLTRRLLLHCD
jgi:hypothetical protein